MVAATKRMFGRMVRDMGNLWTHPAFRRSPLTVLWRGLAWTILCVLRIPATARFRHWGFALRLPAKWRGGGATTPFLFREDYEPEAALLPSLLKPGMVFVDGGANTGVFTFLAAKLVGPTGRVLAFEPGQACFAALQQSARINEAEHVSVRSEALSDRTGVARLYHHRGNDNSFGLGANQAEGVPFEEIETVTLTEALAQEGVNRLDFLKLDIEGAQEIVLREARELLARNLPIVVLEVDAGACRRLNLDPEGAEMFLRELGYQIYRVSDQGTLERLGPHNGFRSLVAAPRERDLIKECTRVEGSS